VVRCPNAALGLSQDQLDKIKAEFAEIDEDGDGQITAEELWKYLDGIVDFDDVEAVVKAQDKDGDGSVSLEEFLANEAANIKAA